MMEAVRKDWVRNFPEPTASRLGEKTCLFAGHPSSAAIVLRPSLPRLMSNTYSQAGR